MARFVTIREDASNDHPMIYKVQADQHRLHLEYSAAGHDVFLRTLRSAPPDTQLAVAIIDLAEFSVKVIS